MKPLSSLFRSLKQPFAKKDKSAKPSAPQVEITPAKIQDSVELKGVEDQAFPEPWPLQALEHQMSQPSVLTSLALSGGATMGYIMLNMDLGQSRVANVDSVGVKPKSQGQGVGKKLMLHALKQAREGGAEAVSLQVEKDNAPAQGLYKKLGFEVTEELKGYYGGNKDALHMVLPELQGESLGKQLDHLS